MRILRKREVLTRTGLSHTVLYELINAGKFPRQISLSRRCVGWPDQEIDRWIEEKIANRDQSGAQN